MYAFCQQQMRVSNPPVFVLLYLSLLLQAGSFKAPRSRIVCPPPRKVDGYILSCTKTPLTLILYLKDGDKIKTPNKKIEAGHTKPPQQSEGGVTRLYILLFNS